MISNWKKPLWSLWFVQNNSAMYSKDYYERAYLDHLISGKVRHNHTARTACQWHDDPDRRACTSRIRTESSWIRCRRPGKTGGLVSPVGSTLWRQMIKSTKNGVIFLLLWFSPWNYCLYYHLPSIHTTFKSLKIMQIWQDWVQRLSNLAWVLVVFW